MEEQAFASRRAVPSMASIEQEGVLIPSRVGLSTTRPLSRTQAVLEPTPGQSPAKHTNTFDQDYMSLLTAVEMDLAFANALSFSVTLQACSRMQTSQNSPGLACYLSFMLQPVGILFR